MGVRSNSEMHQSEEGWLGSAFVLFVILVGTFFVANALAWWGQTIRNRRILGKIDKLAPISEQAAKGKRIPISLITGYLGSGKTTLLNHILRGDHGKLIAVVENEVGAISIDHTLIAQAIPEDRIFILQNGCMCCSADGSQDQLERLLDKLVQLNEHEDVVNYVLVETTGMADPAPIIQALWNVADRGARFVMDATVTVVDAREVHRHLDRGSLLSKSEALHQILHADILLLNKCDTVDEEHLTALSAKLELLNPTARQHRCEYGKLPLDDVLDVGVFDPIRLRSQLTGRPVHADGAAHRSYAAPITLSGGQLDQQSVHLWLQKLVAEHGDQLLRVKGVLAVHGDDCSWIVQGVHHELRLYRQSDMAAAEGSALLVVGIKMDRAALEHAFAQCEHNLDSKVTSLITNSETQNEKKTK